MSSFSRQLSFELNKMDGYLSSLPIKKYYWFAKNQVLNTSLTVFVLLPSALFALQTAVLGFRMLGYMVFSIAVINAAVYVIHLKQLRNTTIKLSVVVLLLFATHALMG